MSLSGIRARMTLVILTFYLHQTHLRLLVIDAGEGAQLTIIILQIREGNQRLMLRAVVPRQVMTRHGECDTVIKNTVHIIDFHLILIHRLCCEEACWWHLLRVAYTDQRLTTSNGADGLTSRHLRCLIEDHQVELLPSHVDILSHTDRTHQHARTELRQ